MKLKKLLVFSTLVTYSTINAEDGTKYCQYSENSPNQPYKCITLGIEGSATAATGIYSAFNYSRMRIIENNNTRVVYSNSTNSIPVNNSKAILEGVGSNDRIILSYTLNDEMNRANYIKGLEQKLKEELKMLKFYEIKAKRITIFMPFPGASIPVPVKINSLAEKYKKLSVKTQKNITLLNQKLENAKNGGKVTIKIHTKSLRDKEGNKLKAQNLISKLIGQESTIQKIKVLPEIHFIKVRRLFKRSMTAGFGFIVAGALFMQDSLTDITSNKLRKIIRNSKIKLKSYK